ncbi:MAG TPA: TetR/AcrR family transcriptional regulator [Bacteroidales bacterium]|nr:TetR/AcrR family transcriptional regulator [Bacteroidales bacterium]
MNQTKDISTEQLILETAEKLFLEKGFAMTSTTEIARVSGCNQALVHYYFRTKENLFQSIFENKFRMLISTLPIDNQSNKPFEEQLASIVEAHFELIRSNPKLPFLIFNELITNPQRLKTLKQRLGELPRPMFLQLQRQLQEEIDEGRIRQTNILDLLLTMLSLNVMIFLGTPIIQNVMQLSDNEINELYEHRKKENVMIILRSLRP